MIFSFRPPPPPPFYVCVLASGGAGITTEVFLDKVPIPLATVVLEAYTPTEYRKPEKQQVERNKGRGWMQGRPEGVVGWQRRRQTTFPPSRLQENSFSLSGKLAGARDNSKLQRKTKENVKLS